ncbi:MAG: ABC transporter substrate-binding protein [Burkholderiales bacterium]
MRAMRWSWMCLALALASQPAGAEKKYSPGASDSEIKIGQTMPYSGPVSAYGAIGRAQAAYFDKVNAEGGINGRKIKLISLDDGYSPAKTVEHTRRMVEQDEVLLMFNSVGTATNKSVRKYLNQKQVPQLFVAGGDSGWSDYKQFPWTIGWMPSYRSEAKLYAQHILKHRPNAKIGVLYLNDDFGKDYLAGFKEGLGERATIVLAEPYEMFYATVDSQVVSLKAAGVDTLFTATAGKHASQALRKIWDIGWKPAIYTAVPAVSPRTVLEPAGAHHAVGMITAYYAKDPNSSRYKDDPVIKEYHAWAKQYYSGDARDGIAAYGYQMAQVLEYVLRKCGDDLTRENIMRVATSMQDVEFPMLIAGVKANTSPTDYRPLEQLVMTRFDGKEWVPFTDLLSP